jgi:hypothetical protein
MQGNIAPRREIVNTVNRVSRQYAFAPQSRQSHLGGMTDLSAKRRAALQALISRYGRRKRNWVAIKAGVAESALRAFLKGDTAYLEEPTYEKLATWSGWTVPELKGETDPPTSDDIMSRKSGTPRERANDLVTDSGQNAYRTNAGSPESEGQDMGDRLFFDILDKLEALPPAHLHRLRVVIDRMDVAEGRVNPREAGIAE